MTALRLFLHVVAASVWVGGLLILVGIAPSTADMDRPLRLRLLTSVDLLIWPAFALTVLTGLWNVMTIPVTDLPHPWIELHVLAVAVSGVAAGVGRVLRDRPPFATALTVAAGVAAVTAMYLGIVVTT